MGHGFWPPTGSAVARHDFPGLRSGGRGRRAVAPDTRLRGDVCEKQEIRARPSVETVWELLCVWGAQGGRGRLYIRPDRESRWRGQARWQTVPTPHAGCVSLQLRTPKLSMRQDLPWSC